MPHTINIYQRLTHRYVDAYRHLDEEVLIGQVKQLGLTRSVAPAGYDDGGTYLFRVVAPPDMKHADLSRAISSTLSHSGCSHEYDCCGCASQSARVKRLTKREYAVRLRVSFNY
jgi:hypothetical protein